MWFIKALLLILDTTLGLSTGAQAAVSGPLATLPGPAVSEKLIPFRLPGQVGATSNLCLSWYMHVEDSAGGTRKAQDEGQRDSSSTESF